MAVDEQILHRPEAGSSRPPMHRATDSIAVVAVLVASLAMIAALVAVGFAARAVNQSNDTLARATAAAPTPPVGATPPVTAAAAPAATQPASTSGTAVAAAVSAPAGPAGPATALAITEHDFAITPAQTSIPAGLVDLQVTDHGPTAHELLIFQTDLAPDKLPLGPDGRVDETGDGVQKVFDSGDNIDVGTTKTFHAALAPGNYVMICNLPGHYKAGMHTAFTVTGVPEVGTVVPAPAA